MPPRPHLVAYSGLKPAGRLSVGRKVGSGPAEFPPEAVPPPGAEAGTGEPRQGSGLGLALLALAVGCEVAAFLMIVSIADLGLTGIRELAWPLAILGLASVVCSWLGRVAPRGEQQSDSVSAG